MNGLFRVYLLKIEFLFFSFPKVKGCVMDSKGNMKWVVAGEWDNKIEIAPVISSNGTSDNPVIKTGPYTLAWLRKMPA